MKNLARIVSVLSHPLLFPIYGFVLLFAANPGLYGHFPNLFLVLSNSDKAKHELFVVWFIIIFALTFVFPTVWLLMMRRLEMIVSLKLETTGDRIIPFIATATFYLWAAWMFKPNVHMKIPTDKLIFLMMLGYSFTIFLALITNIYMKASLHTIGAGTLLGIILPIIRISPFDLRFVFVALILVAGIIGVARLILKAHNAREVFTGYAIGFTGQFISFSIVSRFF